MCRWWKASSARRRSAGSGWWAPLLVSWALLVGCDIREKQIKAKANGIRADIARVHAHFASEAQEICSEKPVAETPVVPPLDRSCSDGCGCAAGGEVSATLYDCDEWSAPEWKLLRFAGRYALDGKTNEKVYFHHRARWARTEQGCRLEFTVFGDLDEDGVYSTYVSTIETEPGGPLGHLPDVSLLFE